MKLGCGHEVEARFIEKHLMKCHVFWICPSFFLS